MEPQDRDEFIAMKMLTRFKQLRREDPNKPQPDIGWMLELLQVVRDHTSTTDVPAIEPALLNDDDFGWYRMAEESFNLAITFQRQFVDIVCSMSAIKHIKSMATRRYSAKLITLTGHHFGQRLTFQLPVQQ